MNDEVHAARFASKVHTSSLSAFSSAPNGPIGSVSEGRPYFTVELARSEPLEVPDEWDDSVELVVATLGVGRGSSRVWPPRGPRGSSSPDSEVVTSRATSSR